MSPPTALSIEFLPLISAALAAISGYTLFQAVPAYTSEPIHRAVKKYRDHVQDLLTACFLRQDANRSVFIQLSLWLAGTVLAVAGGFGLLSSALTLGLLLTIPYLLLRIRVQRRREALGRQLEEMLVLMGHTVRVHPSMLEAVKGAASAMNSPAKEELELVLSEVRLGADIVESLVRMSERMPSTDLQMALSAIQISRQVGSDLSAMLEQVVHTLREIRRLEGLIDSKTSAGRMQAKVMMAIPVLVTVGVYILQPDYIIPMFQHPTQQKPLELNSSSCFYAGLRPAA